MKQQNPILFCLLVIIAILSVASGAKASDFLSDGNCYIDANGRQICPLKKAAAATGKVLQVAANVVTPNNVALPMQASQQYSSPAAVHYSSAAVSTGWSKSWHKVHGQPIRNIGRRLLGR